MPSNPTLPEDVRAELKRKLAYELCTQWPPCADHEETAGAAIDLIAPLIIEWARKDQAEVDAQTVRSLSAEYRAQGIGVPGFSVEAQGRILKPITPETTGGTTNE